MIRKYSSAIVIPVPDTETLVGNIRREHDPSARRGVPAHITLIVPFFAAPVPPDVIVELTAMFAAAPSFELEFRSVGQFETTLFLTPAPAGPIIALIEELVRRWPEHPPYGGIYDTIVPHLTVVDDQDGALCEDVTSQLMPHLPITTRICEAWLIESDEEGFWRRRAMLPFGDARR
ncbi:MAG: hypothetical protein QOD51_284 [Candidatus Eremiobacteraeota bacterium]|nr:hypothetical protein [Candidatus Eremiobacteraeota bacterium]